MTLTLSPNRGDWDRDAARFHSEHVLARLHAIDTIARRDGLPALAPKDEPLIGLGMEVDPTGRVTKSGFGVFDLAWQAAAHPEWAKVIAAEVGEIRAGIERAHGTTVRFLIWAGMGGSVEDKSMYAAAGLLRGVHFYALDSTDPAKLKAILSDIERRSRQSLSKGLRSTLVVGMALGMTSYEPVVNLEKLTALYDRHGIDGRANFLYLTLPGSILDQFARPRGYRNVPMQLDGRYTTSGRHSGPLTRGSLYPLALAGMDLGPWMAGTDLDEKDIATAWRLASFLHHQGQAGRDKVTLILPREWRAVGLWTKQNFEESLGKSDALGIKVVIDERPRAASYRPATDARQDRVFLVVKFKGAPADANADLLRRRGYPVATLEWPRRTSLSRYMQLVHYTVFGLGYLRSMNFVTQPSVELYKRIANDLHAEAKGVGGITATTAWRAMSESTHQATWRRRVTLYFDDVPVSVDTTDAARIYATILRQLSADRQIEYGELTLFGDMRFSPSGRAMRALLGQAADRLFRRALQMPADVYEGPAMNHSFHEMIIGHGRCLSTILLSRAQASIPAIGYGSEYHVAQFLATKLALAQRRRPVVAIVLDDLREPTRTALEAFFAAAATHLRSAEDS